ncbi:glycosyltransferase family 2 protein [Nioella nitratireducens]|uniref:glycosyltransferase family 2 protein n=1 Tax=Nioella nitratireducens TaxID=1287720 RepID=UPI0009FD5D18|nr:glycosyltransferase family A protein [Nioella nitratireducens]
MNRLPWDPDAAALRERLLADSGLFDSEWYAARYDDAARSGLDPWTHFLAFGWDLGRDPGPTFDSRAYLTRYCDVLGSETDALTHYLLHGAKEGRSANPFADDPVLSARALSDMLRIRLNVLGQRSALRALQRVACDEHGDQAAFAARDLALWHLRQWRESERLETAKTARHWANLASESAVDPILRGRLLTVRLVAEAISGMQPPSQAQLGAWAEEGRLTPEIWFALTGFESTEADRLSKINQALRAYDLAPLALRPNATSNLYDRLDSASPANPVDGPLVTVLIAAYNAEATLQTALRAMRGQSWRNLEILVIDDASSDHTAEIARDAAEADGRIRLISQSQNGGAYAARNVGLAAARGAYVTIHDADDWCHPERISRQMAILTETEGAIACTSEHVRIQPDLTLTRLSPEAHFLTENTASLLFERLPVVEALGCWDEVRVAADNEFIRRMRRIFGSKAVISAETGPLALLRDQHGSAVRGGPLSIDGYVTGARLAYLDAQEHHHRTAHPSALCYAPGDRPFPAPQILRGNIDTQTLSLLVAADPRRPDRVMQTCLQLIDAAAGSVGFIPLVRPIPPCQLDPPPRVCPALLRALSAGKLRHLCPGETASASLLIVPDPEALVELPGALPSLLTERVRLLADHSPVSVLPSTGRQVTRYDPVACEAAIRNMASGAFEWWALTPTIRAALTRAGATNVGRKLLTVTDPGRVLR